MVVVHLCCLDSRNMNAFDEIPVGNGVSIIKCYAADLNAY